MDFVLRHKWKFIGTTLGFIAGYLYWYFIGCTSGSCPIQSHWYTSAFYGAFLGYLFSDIKRKKIKKEESHEG